MSLKLQHLDLQKNRIIINSTKAFRGAKLQTANQMVAKEDMKRTNLLCIFSPSVNAKRLKFYCFHGSWKIYTKHIDLSK